MSAGAQLAAIVKRRRRGNVILRDGFNRPNGALGSAETGQLYTVHVGGWSISGGIAVSDATGNNIVSAECNAADGFGQLDVLSGQRFLAFRVIDGANFLLAGFQGGSSILVLFQCVAGAFSEINAGSGVDVGALTGTVAVRAVGSTIYSYFNGVLRRTDTTAQFQTATRWGMFGQSSTFDNLLVTRP